MVYALIHKHQGDTTYVQNYLQINEYVYSIINDYIINYYKNKSIIIKSVKNYSHKIKYKSNFSALDQKV